MSWWNWVSVPFCMNFKVESSLRLQNCDLTSNLLDDNTPKRVMQPEPGSCGIRSSGLRVARTYMYDWFMLMVLMGILAIIHALHPFYRFVGKDMIGDFKYPLKDDTVPFWSVPIFSLVLPILIFTIIYFRRRDVYDLHHAVLGLLYAILVTAVITNAIKNAVGRPRPDFFWRCFPDGKDVYDRLGGVICHGQKKIIEEGHRSFPSGHTSWSFSGLCFLSLYSAGKVKAFGHDGHIAKLCIVFLPLLAASLVGVSRVDNYKHHWQDVLAGGLLGVVVAMFCYLQFFPPPYHAKGCVPYACFEDPEPRPVTPSNGEVVLNEVATGEGQLASERSGNRSIRSSLWCTSDIEEDMESCLKPPSIEVAGPGDDGSRLSQGSYGLNVSPVSHTRVPSLEEVESGVHRYRSLFIAIFSVFWVEIDGELRDTRFIRKDVPLNLLNDHFLRRFLSQLLIFIIIVHVVTNTDEFLAKVRAG